MNTYPSHLNSSLGGKYRSSRRTPALDGAERSRGVRQWISSVFGTENVRPLGAVAWHREQKWRWSSWTLRRWDEEETVTTKSST